jgi:hypothetical protein
MRGLGVLVAVAVSGYVGAWITKLVVGSVAAPLFFIYADDAPTLTEHWKAVLIAGGLVQALMAALLLVVIMPSLSGYRIEVGPAFAAMLIGNMVSGIALLVIGEARIHAHAAYLPTLTLDTLATALLGIGVSALIATAGVRTHHAPPGSYPAGSFGELRRTSRSRV